VASDESRAAEAAAAEIVRAVLGVPVEQRDVEGAPPATPDFAILKPDGELPLEVTRSTDGPHRRFWDQISNTDWNLPTIASSWWVSVGYSYPLAKDLRRSLSQVLPRLEEAEVAHFEMSWEDERGNSPDHTAPWAPMAEVGVIRGRVVDANTKSPYVFIGNAGGFATSPEAVNVLIATEAANNAKKLGEQGHLFIWVDSLDHHAWVGMDLDHPPVVGPADVPPGATFWVARKGADAWTSDRLWLLRPGESWRSVALRES